MNPESKLIEISTLPLTEIIELQARLFAVHISDFKPIQFAQIARNNDSLLIQEFQKKVRCRPS